MLKAATPNARTPLTQRTGLMVRDGSRPTGNQERASRAFLISVDAAERSSSRNTQRRARRSDSGLSGTMIVTRLPVHGSRTVRVILGPPQNHHQSARLRAQTL